MTEQAQAFKEWFKKAHDTMVGTPLGEFAWEVWEIATQAERERCALLAESCDDGGENHQYNNACTDIAKAIRGA